MKRIQAWKMMIVLPATLALAVAVGCTGGPTGPTGDTGSGGGPGVAPTVETKDVVVKGLPTGTIKGVVKLAGDPKLDERQKSYDELLKTGSGADTAHCTKDDPENNKKYKTYQALKVGKDNGVKNAVVWVRPAKGKHFLFEKSEVDDLMKGRKAPEVDQPFCAFDPHVSTLWPDYYDAKKKPTPTGEKLTIKNTAPMAHNTKWFRGTSALGNQTINANVGKLEIDDIKDDYSAPAEIACDIHKYMKGYIVALEHPFVAIADDDGKFEIKGVPAGVDLFVVGWHELGDGGKEPGFLGKGKVNGDKIKLEEGKDLTQNYELKVQ